MLARLDVATQPQQLDVPGFRLHALKGDLAGYWSITVRANWRIIFEKGDATDVDLVDYQLKTTGGTAMTMKNPPHPGL